MTRWRCGNPAPWLAAFVLILGLGGCAAPPPDDSSLVGEPFYADLGGGEGVAAIIDAFLVELAGDERLLARFAMTDIARFRRLLIEHLCQLSGGPCTYSGDSMLEAHRTMGIEPGEFDALVRALMRAMDHAGVSQGAQNRLLGRLAPMYDDIVDR